jgi:hypothetical protein
MTKNSEKEKAVVLDHLVHEVVAIMQKTKVTLTSETLIKAAVHDQVVELVKTRMQMNSIFISKYREIREEHQLLFH